MVTHIKGNDIADCWEKIVVNIVNNGHYVNDERGSLTKECLNIVTEIKDPFSVGGNDFFGMGDALEKLENIIVNNLNNEERLKKMRENIKNNWSARAVSSIVDDITGILEKK